MRCGSGAPPVADVMVGYRDTVTVCKINEAIAKQTRIVLDPALYEV